MAEMVACRGIAFNADRLEMVMINAPHFCFVETDSAGNTHVAVFDPRYTAAIDYYTITAATTAYVPAAVGVHTHAPAFSTAPPSSSSTPPVAGAHTTGSGLLTGDRE